MKGGVDGLMLDSAPPTAGKPAFDKSSDSASAFAKASDFACATPDKSADRCATPDKSAGRLWFGRPAFAAEAVALAE